MEEVEDIIPETEPQEFPEEVEIMAEPRTAEVIPEPPQLKRETNKLKDKVTCEGCGKVCLYMRTSILISVKRVHLMSHPKKSKSIKSRKTHRMWRKKHDWHS